MKTPPDSALADAQGIVADLRRQLAERTAERDEALAQQTATAEVLQVITSPGDLGPVFDAVIEKATRLCNAASGTFFIRDGELIHPMGMQDMPGPFAEYLANEPVRLRTMLGSSFLEAPLLHIADLAASEAYERRVPLATAAVELGGIRTFLVVPLLKEGALVGIFAIYRKEVRPFSEKEIALLENFAAQAMIAMENARLLDELRHRTGQLEEALEQQTATVEVLQVINSSPGDLTRVFDTMLEKAMRLCEAKFGELHI
jgi:GAF domain-containing protein